MAVPDRTFTNTSVVADNPLEIYIRNARRDPMKLKQIRQASLPKDAFSPAPTPAPSFNNRPLAGEHSDEPKTKAVTHSKENFDIDTLMSFIQSVAMFPLYFFKYGFMNSILTVYFQYCAIFSAHRHSV